MNKPIFMPELTATRARTGMNRVGDLIALLVKQYELKEEMRNRQLQARSAQTKPAARAGDTPSASIRKAQTAEFVNGRMQKGKSTPVQATFAWFDGAGSDRTAS